MRKFHFILLGAVVTATIQGLSQPSDHAPVMQMPFMEGLTLTTDLDTPFSLDGKIPIYSFEGDKIEPKDVRKMMVMGGLYIDIYVDKSKEAKVLVLRPLTEEEQQERELLMGSRVDAAKDLIGKDAIPFSLTDLQDNHYSIDELQGKVVVLNFWFIGCKPCIMEMPELNKLVEKYRDENIVFLGLSLDLESALRSFLEKKEFKYQIIPDASDVIQSYGINTFPTHIVIDKDSRITWATSGLSPFTMGALENEIELALEK